MMTYVILGGLIVIILLVIALIIVIKVAQAKGLEIKKLEANLAAERESRKRQAIYQEKREEAQQNADDKKETLHTGDDTVDFNNSIDVLHGSSNNRTR